MRFVTQGFNKFAVKAYLCFFQCLTKFPFMILYNVTVNIDEEVRDEWLAWMKEVHIPDLLNTGLFTSCKLARIMAEEAGGNAYSIQYFAPSILEYERYVKEYAPKFQAEHNEKFNGKFAAFRTLLHVIHEA